MFRRALLAAVLTTAASVFVLAGPAQARVCAIDSYCARTYYSDNTYTTVVGAVVIDCAGEVTNWGVRTIYQDFLEIPC